MHPSVVLAIAIAIVPATAFAQPKDPKFEFGKSEEVEKVKAVEWVALAEAGLVFTTGNSKTTTVVGGFKAARKTGNNKLAIEGALTYAKSSVRVLADGVDPTMDITRDDILTVDSTTSESLFAKLRYDRFLTKHNSLFGAALAARDLPAGKESVIGGQAGYSRQLKKTKTDEAVVEFGYDYSRENLVAGPSVSIHSMRGFVGYKATMTPGTTLDTALEVLTNMNHENLVTRADGADFGEDTRINFKTAVSAKIGRNLAIQTSFEAKYDNRPAPLVFGGKPVMLLGDNAKLEASSFDTILKVSLIYAFFPAPPPPPPKPVDCTKCK